jgi:hypothetical protein
MYANTLILQRVAPRDCTYRALSADGQAPASGSRPRRRWNMSGLAAESSNDFSCPCPGGQVFMRLIMAYRDTQSPCVMKCCIQRMLRYRRNCSPFDLWTAGDRDCVPASYRNRFCNVHVRGLPRASKCSTAEGSLEPVEFGHRQLNLRPDYRTRLIRSFLQQQLRIPCPRPPEF